MIKHYILIARRHLVKNRLLSFINISGLSLGITACLLMVSYVTHEMTFDKFITHADRVFLMCVRAKVGVDSLDIPYMNYSSGPVITQADPRVESFQRTFTPYSAVTIADPLRVEMKFREKNVLFADSSFFRFFPFKLRSGNVSTALSEPLTMVISRKAAYKYFGDADPIGKTLQYDNKYLFQITGVAEEPPSNSSIRFDFVASMESLRTMKATHSMNAPSRQIGYGEFATWLLLRNGQDKQAVQTVIQQVYEQDREPSSPVDRYYLTGLKDYHFNNKFHDTSNSQYLMVFSLVAILVLLLALVNYMSLATADSSIRSKEIGVRKIAGASAPAIRVQFYVESALYSLIAFSTALLIVLIFGGKIFSMMGLTIDFEFLLSPFLLSLFVLLFIFTTLIAGFYPSLVLSKLNPQAILGGSGVFRNNSALVREFFTVFQFSLAVALIIFCLTVNSQVHFFRHMSTGVARQNVIMIPMDDSSVNHFGAFSREISAIPGVKHTAIARYPLYGGIDRFPASAINSEPIQLSVILVDQHFIPLLELQWKQRPADPFYYRQAKRILLNEAAAKRFKFQQDAIGQNLQVFGDTYLKVSGVLNDFVFTNLKSAIEPLGLIVKGDSSFSWAKGGDACLFIKAEKGTNLPKLLSAVKTTYAKYNNTTPFSFEFLDDVFDSQYKAEQRLEKVLNICTILIIFIASMGLFGLMYFNVNRKLKEISVRKVLGANRVTIVVLMCRKLFAIIGLSILIGSPIAWYIADSWLQDFPYHVQVGWEIFMVTILGTLLISFITILMQVMRAVNASPVKNLKN
ncbi:hypothetical protein A4R26_20795 [Niastella populi]|uniref:Cell division protein FtsX n=2 Tax=Niastella populi TaxID=550983 RepID=A0A1V9FNJ9_9BACT|nr:hypothetical protein A4R26_20795 [Niastella populi]